MPPERTDRSANDDEYLRASEAAALLHVSPQTVSRWADEGRIRYAVTIGGHRRFPQSEVERLLRATGERN